MIYRRRLKFFLLKFLRLHGTPHKVALGFAIGSAINFIPTFGFAIPLAAFIAGIFRLNIAAAVIGDIVVKPLFPAFLYLDIYLGNLLLGKSTGQMSNEIRALLQFDFLSLKAMGMAFFIGMLLNFVLFTLLTYFIIFTLLKYYRLPMLRGLKESKVLD